jgi:hypothetical protein
MSSTATVSLDEFHGAIAHLGLAVPRTPRCKPWCVVHCRFDDNTTFCMGRDIVVPVVPSGYVGITYCPEEGGQPHIDLGHGTDSATVEEAEAYALAILAQVAKAREQDSF